MWDEKNSSFAKFRSKTSWHAISKRQDKDNDFRDYHNIRLFYGVRFFSWVLHRQFHECCCLAIAARRVVGLSAEPLSEMQPFDTRVGKHSNHKLAVSAGALFELPSANFDKVSDRRGDYGASFRWNMGADSAVASAAGSDTRLLLPWGVASCRRADRHRPPHHSR